MNCDLNELPGNESSQNHAGSAKQTVAGLGNGDEFAQSWFATVNPDDLFDSANDAHSWVPDDPRFLDFLNLEAPLSGRLASGDSSRAHDTKASKIGHESNPAQLDKIHSSLSPKVFTCSEKGCTTEKTYKTKAGLQRHIAKHHTNAYACSLGDCRSRAFGSKADLLRHRREIHSQSEGKTLQKFCCPVPSCQRHRVGFPREFNMFNHFQRMHARSIDKLGRREEVNSTMERGNDSDEDEDDSDPEPSVRISAASPCEVRSLGRGLMSNSRKLRDELEAMSQDFDSRMRALQTEFKARSETWKRAIDLLEENE